MYDNLPAIRQGTKVDDIQVANTLARSKLLPVDYQNSPASILWAQKLGEGLGINVASTMQAVHIIQGKPTISAQMMAALVLRHGHRIRTRASDSAVEVKIIRKDDPDFEHISVWTMARAKQAQLTGKENWVKYPIAMLRARAISECARMACPDVLLGWYTPDELGAVTTEDGEPRGHGRIITSPEQKIAEQAVQCTSAAQVVTLLERAKAARLLTSLVITPDGPLTLDAYLRSLGKELLAQESTASAQSEESKEKE